MLSDKFYIKNTHIYICVYIYSFNTGVRKVNMFISGDFMEYYKEQRKNGKRRFGFYFDSLKQFILRCIFDKFEKVRQINIAISPDKDDEYDADDDWNKNLVLKCLEYLYCEFMFQLLIYPFTWMIPETDDKKINLKDIKNTNIDKEKVAAVSRWKRVRIRLWFGDKQFWPSQATKYTIKADSVSDVHAQCLSTVNKAFEKHQQRLKKTKDYVMRFGANDLFVLQL